MSALIVRPQKRAVGIILDFLVPTYAREKTGDEVIGEVGVAIPGLAQFV